MNKKTTSEILVYLNLEHGRPVTEELINLWSIEFADTNTTSAWLAAKWIMHHPQRYGPAKVFDFSVALIEVTTGPAIAPSANEALKCITEGLRLGSFSELPKLVAVTAKSFGDFYSWKTDSNPNFTRTQFVKEYEANRERYFATKCMPEKLKNQIKQSRLNAKEKLLLDNVNQEAARISQRPATGKQTESNSNTQAGE